MVSFSTDKIIHCTVVRNNFEKNLPYEHYLLTLSVVTIRLLRLSVVTIVKL